MTTFRVVVVLLVVFAACVVSTAGARLAARAKSFRTRTARVSRLNARLGKENGRTTFPAIIEGDIEVMGLGPKRIRASLDEEFRTPMIEEIGGTVKQKRMKRKDTAYYTGPDGAFACKPGKLNKEKCDLFGVIYEGNENCLIKEGKAYCAEIEAGVDVVLDPLTDAVVVEGNRRKKRESRSKRNIVEPSSSTNVINVAMFFDKEMVNRFKSFNGGSYFAAVSDLEEYAILLNNELTYRFQTCKSYSNGLDLSVDVVHIAVPSNNQDFSFIRKDGQGRLDYSQTLSNFRTHSSVISLVQNGGTAHHAMLFTGLVFDNPNTIGVAYLSTVCRSNAQQLRVSIQRDLDFNVANIGSHEVGHALGAYHDGQGNTCPNNTHLLGPILSGVTAETASTYYTFSECSNDQFVAHLSNYGNCLAAKTADFVTRFCQGPRGRFNYASLDEQCQRANSPITTDVTACGVTEVSADQCWQQRAFSCCGGSQPVQGIADGTPCTGSDPNVFSYCYLGACRDGDSICGVSVTTTSATTTTTTPTTTTTTATTTTTTATTTTTTTTPTTTTTTPTTTTTAPTTTTTTAPTTTTTAPTTTTTTATTTTTTATTTTTTATTTTTTPTTTTTTATTTTTTPTTTTTTPTTTTTAPPCPSRTHNNNVDPDY